MINRNKTSIFSLSAGRRRFATAGRACAGFSLVETFTSGIFIIVAAIISLDTWFMIMAARINDSVCRDAAKAAAQAGNSQNSATYAAMAAAQPYVNMGSVCMVAPPEVQVVYNAAAPPSVVVTANCTVKTLIPIPIFGNLSKNNINFVAQYAYPIVPSTVGVQANNIAAGAAN